MKFELFVLDLPGDFINELSLLKMAYEKNWRLITVVALPDARRAYLEREIPEPPASETDKSRKLEFFDAGFAGQKIPEPPATPTTSTGDTGIPHPIITKRRKPGPLDDVAIDTR